VLNKIDGRGKKSAIAERLKRQSRHADFRVARSKDRGRSVQKKVKKSGSGLKCADGDHPFRRVSWGLRHLVSCLWADRFRDSPTFLLSFFVDEPLLSQPPFFRDRHPNIPWRQVTPASLQLSIHSPSPMLSVKCYLQSLLCHQRDEHQLSKSSALIVRLEMMQLLREEPRQILWYFEF